MQRCCGCAESRLKDLNAAQHLHGCRGGLECQPAQWPGGGGDSKPFDSHTSLDKIQALTSVIVNRSIWRISQEMIEKYLHAFKKNKQFSVKVRLRLGLSRCRGYRFPTSIAAETSVAPSSGEALDFSSQEAPGERRRCSPEQQMEPGRARGSSAGRTWQGGKECRSLAAPQRAAGSRTGWAPRLAGRHAIKGFRSTGPCAAGNIAVDAWWTAALLCCWHWFIWHWIGKSCNIAFGFSLHLRCWAAVTSSDAKPHMQVCFPASGTWHLKGSTWINWEGFHGVEKGTSKSLMIHLETLTCS